MSYELGDDEMLLIAGSPPITIGGYIPVSQQMAESGEMLLVGGFEDTSDTELVDDVAAALADGGTFADVDESFADWVREQIERRHGGGSP